MTKSERLCVVMKSKNEKEKLKKGTHQKKSRCLHILMEHDFGSFGQENIVRATIILGERPL